MPEKDNGSAPDICQAPSDERTSRRSSVRRGRKADFERVSLGVASLRCRLHLDIQRQSGRLGQRLFPKLVEIGGRVVAGW